MRHLLCADLARSKAFFEAWNKRSLLSFSWRWTVGCRVPPSPNPVARWVTSGLTKSRVPVPGVGVDRAGVRQPYWPVACLSGGPFFDPLGGQPVSFYHRRGVWRAALQTPFGARQRLSAALMGGCGAYLCQQARSPRSVWPKQRVQGRPPAVVQRTKCQHSFHCRRCCHLQPVSVGRN